MVQHDRRLYSHVIQHESDDATWWIITTKPLIYAATLYKWSAHYVNNRRQIIKSVLYHLAKWIKLISSIPYYYLK